MKSSPYGEWLYAIDDCALFVVSSHKDNLLCVLVVHMMSKQIPQNVHLLCVSILVQHNRCLNRTGTF
jgi:hypothetical protein